MSYIVGTYLPNDKTLIYSLIRIYGVGLFRAKQICKGAGFGIDCRTSNISLKQIAGLESLVEASGFSLGSDLRRFNEEKIHHLCEIFSYKGFRHRKGLPVRGQRTHTNSKRRVIFKWKKII